MKRFEKIKRTFAHRKAFIITQNELFGRNTLRGLFHDVDKYFLYLFFGAKWGSKIHKRISRHHKRAKTKEDYKLIVVDWECGRLTKKDSPLNAYDYLYTVKQNKMEWTEFHELENEIRPILIDTGLDHPTGWGC